MQPGGTGGAERAVQDGGYWCVACAGQVRRRDERDEQVVQGGQGASLRPDKGARMEEKGGEKGGLSGMHGRACASSSTIY